MWKCHLCNVCFTKESVQHHLFIHHIRPKIGNPQVYNCGDCIFSAEDFEAIAEHCLTLYHEPTKVTKGLDYERYPAELFRTLKTVMRSPYAGVGDPSFIGGSNITNSPEDNNDHVIIHRHPGGHKGGINFQHLGRSGIDSDSVGPRSHSNNNSSRSLDDWSDISFQADITHGGRGDSGGSGRGPGMVESDDENPFNIFGGPAGLTDEDDNTADSENLDTGDQEKSKKRKADDNNNASKKPSKKSKIETEKEPEEPPRPEPVSPLDIGNYIHIWQDLPNPYKITLLGTFWKPNDRFPYPYVHYGEGMKKRCRFAPRWFAQYSWLAYTQREGGGALCAPCVLFNEGPKRGSLVQAPFQKYKNGLERFARHSETLWHRQAMQSMELAAKEFQAAAEEKDVVVDPNQLLDKLREANEKYKKEETEKAAAASEKSEGEENNSSDEKREEKNSSNSLDEPQEPQNEKEHKPKESMSGGENSSSSSCSSTIPTSTEFLKE